MGRVDDFYFDDNQWTLRYLVADTGRWLSDQLVLVSPHALVAAIKEKQHIAVDLTQKQIEGSPPITTDQPISRQYEKEFHQYYGWGAFWGAPMGWGAYPPPRPLGTRGEAEKEGEGDPHLRSAMHLSAYSIQAIDDEIGHVEDFIIEDVTWVIRYFIVDTRNWWPGKKVLVSLQWFDRANWEELKMYVNLTREEIKQAPEYTNDSILNREYESRLYDHYQREGYWKSGRFSIK